MNEQQQIQEIEAMKLQLANYNAEIKGRKKLIERYTQEADVYIKKHDAMVTRINEVRKVQAVAVRDEQ